MTYKMMDVNELEDNLLTVQEDVAEKIVGELKEATCIPSWRHENRGTFTADVRDETLRLYRVGKEWRCERAHEMGKGADFYEAYADATSAPFRDYFLLNGWTSYTWHQEGGYFYTEDLKEPFHMVWKRPEMRIQKGGKTFNDKTLCSVCSETLEEALEEIVDEAESTVNTIQILRKFSHE
jgi:hypothetical protein